ncbi:MAG: pro-sigmaK processing inhibitor BofA family protein [Clostridia bacterium]|nr:pro-sigmaK processing inhibitor BofA family protein [Clostridia bacterium]
MESNILVAYFIGIIVIFFVGRLFIVPLKYIFKLILNSIFGGVFILLINLIGGNFGFHIGLNLITAIFVGLLGIPGSIVLILLKLMLG